MIWALLIVGCDAKPRGRWASSPALDAQIEELVAMGYADGTMAPAELSGVVVNEAGAMAGDRSYVSGDGPHWRRMAQDGTELERLSRSYWWNLASLPWVSPDHGSTANFRRARRLPDGDIVAIHEGLGLVRFGPGPSGWALGEGIHHDVRWDDDGTLWTLGRTIEVDGANARFRDQVLHVDAVDGSVLGRCDLLTALERGGRSDLLKSTVRESDPLHTNSVVRVPADASAVLGGGDTFVSLRNISALAALDFEACRVTWTGRGAFRMQHDAVLVDGPAVLLFNNGGSSGASRAMELSLPGLKTVWTWSGPPELQLNSPQLGSVSRLPNGNTLVTSSEQGVAYEVTRDLDVVWSFHNPHRAGEHDELVAALFEVEVLP